MGKYLGAGRWECVYLVQELLLPPVFEAIPFLARASPAVFLPPPQISMLFFLRPSCLALAVYHHPSPLVDIPAEWQRPHFYNAGNHPPAVAWTSLSFSVVQFYLHRMT
jgi:hypothetical protein